jgi:hypothetical protein
MKFNSFVFQDDGSATDMDGNYVFVSYKKFINEVVRGECCFLCCSPPDQKTFNDEHIIPRWVLRRFGLFKSSITLKNLEPSRYDKYRLPCCVECNSFLGEGIEEVISAATKDGFEGLNSYIEEHGSNQIFIWLSLIFLKTHLKDAQQRWHLDTTKGDIKLDSETDWSSIHHIYCVVKSLQNQVFLHKECIGTLVIMEAEQAVGIEKFDFADSPSSNTILIQLGDIALFAVLDDSTASAHFIEPIIFKIHKPIDWLQAREIFSHLSYLNILLKTRPSYSTTYSFKNERFEISAKLPNSMELEELDSNLFGQIMFSNYNSSDIDAEVKENMLAGRYTYLSNENS